MNELTIRPITEKEFVEWQKHSETNYSAEKQKEGLSEADARDEAKKSFERLLPQAQNTPEQYVYSIVSGEGARIGTLWWGTQKQGSRTVAWIYDIELLPEQRGKGFGRRAMELAQADVRTKGFDRLGLHVFGHNKTAQSLYLSMGFQAKNIVMYKDL